MARLTQTAVEVFVQTAATTRQTQLAAEVFQAQPATTRLSQSALEVYTPINIPTRQTQVAVELYQARAAVARLSQQLVELWTVKLTCPPADLGETPAGGYACEAGRLRETFSRVIVRAPGPASAVLVGGVMCDTVLHEDIPAVNRLSMSPDAEGLGADWEAFACADCTERLVGRFALLDPPVPVVVTPLA